MALPVAVTTLPPSTRYTTPPRSAIDSVAVRPPSVTSTTEIVAVAPVRDFASVLRSVICHGVDPFVPFHVSWRFDWSSTTRPSLPNWPAIRFSSVRCAHARALRARMKNTKQQRRENLGVIDCAEDKLKLGREWLRLLERGYSGCMLPRSRVRLPDSLVQAESHTPMLMM